MKTFGQLKTAVRGNLWPSGEPSNLINPHNKAFIDSLIDLQTFVDCQQQDNTSIFPQCSTYYNCGLTVIDAPRGAIKAVGVAEEVDGAVSWCTYVEYLQVNPVTIREYLDRSLQCGFCLPIFFSLIPNSCIKGYYPVPSDADVPAGLPVLPLGYHYPQASTDNVYGRAGAGFWAIERGKIFIAPYIQSTEQVIVKWDGIKRAWTDADIVDEDPMLESAVMEYVRWQHEDKFGKDQEESIRAMGAYNNWRSLLMHQCREETRIRDREPSHARSSTGINGTNTTTLYYNEATTYTAKCQDGETGEDVSVTIPAGYIASTISVADANAKALIEAQTQAESRLDCQPETPTYTNVAKTATAAPVHAWATLFLYNVEKDLGRGDFRFLERSFQGLMQNFNWWVNRKDPQGKNVFAGGFLGLDNIGVFDRSSPLPTGGHLDQADGTAWMAFYCQNMLEIAVILADYDSMYEEVAYRFLEHFLWITYAMDRIGEHHDQMWDGEDGFFYDLLHFPNGDVKRLKVRSMVGLLPLCASTVFESGALAHHPRMLELVELFRKRHPDLLKHIAPADGKFKGYADRRLLSVCNKEKIERILASLLDENEFLSPYGIRSLSRYHLDHPFIFNLDGQEFKVQYLPAESNTGMFGGNSNWRGPIWMPVNILLIRGLANLYQFYGDDFKVECPTGSGKYMTLFEVAREVASRLSAIFLRDKTGQRPVYGGTRKFQDDPYWKDYILFYEYFHGDNGAGLGASHQTGWTGTIARSLDLFARLKPGEMLKTAKSDLMSEITRQQVAG